MCGIAGYILKRAIDRPLAVSRALLSEIRRRGPDDEGVCLIDRAEKRVYSFATDRSHVAVTAELPSWECDPVGHDCALFHTRYSIIDTSAGGHQPFQSQDGSCIAVFNGEIYNYLELKEELSEKGVHFRTASDTEVLLEGYAYWKEDLWAKLNGFWAVALYDRRDGSIVLSRDRLGVAPFYVRETSEGIFFSSLIEPLKAVAGRPRINLPVVSLFIEQGVKDTDGRTFYEGIYSLLPAVAFHLLPGMGQIKQARVKEYWRLPDTHEVLTDISFTEAVETFRDLFFDAVRLRLRSHVNLGFELSGGLDSSSVVAAAAELSGKKLTAYTLKVRGCDEEPFARAMLKRYSLDYRVVADLEANLSGGAEAFASVMEEPYDNPANFLHHELLKRMKCEGISVILTGAGGDEVLAGYEASFWPSAYREWRGRRGELLSAEWYEFRRRFLTVSETQKTMSSYCKALQRMVMPWKKPKPVGRTGILKRSYAQERRYHITTALLPYYLRSTDHYTMNIPLEHRFPFLDYRLVEFGVRLPPEYLFKDGFTKFILRKAMEPYLPREILWRKKKFGFPFAHKEYFLGRGSDWDVHLKRAQGLGLFDAQCSYDVLAVEDQHLLWRLLSTGVWLKSVEGA